MIQLCRHILRNNRQCGQPALNGLLFCRHHRDVKDWKRRTGLRSQIRIQTPTQTYDHGTILVAESRTQPLPEVDLEFPEDPAAILTNIYRVTTLLVQGEIDRPTANSVTYGMQVCLSALNGKSLFEPATAAPTRSQSHSLSRSRSDDTDPETSTTYSDSSTPDAPVSRPVRRVILTPDGDEIAPPVEILEENEAEPIHHKGCPCMNCAEKYRNQPPEEHHANCQCGLCEEETSEHSAQSTPATTLGAPSLAQPKVGSGSANFEDCHPERTLSEAKGQSRDLLLAETGTTPGAPSLAQPKVGSDTPNQTALSSVPCALSPRRRRIARASSLLAATTSRDPLNRPWSVAEYTFGDAIRRHEAQYAARAAACLAVGIEPPPYEPFATGLIPAGTPEYEEDQQMQQHSSEYWAAHFRNLLAERPGVPECLEEEKAAESTAGSDNCGLETRAC
jgi:hypothetical protein